MAAVSDLRKELSVALRYYSKGGKRGGRGVPIDTLPLVTDKVWRGIPLNRAMSPAVPETGEETEHLFDSWVWPVKRGEGESSTELAAEGGNALYRYVSKGADFGERTVLLLHALSNANGATLVHDDRAVMVHHDTHRYGIIDGKVFSRFCDGTDVNVDHQRVLTESKKTKVGTREFCYLWSEAYLRRENLIDPLVALWQSCTIIHWAGLVKKPRYQRVIKERNLEQWLGVIECNEDDPLWGLYRVLVPGWMNKTTYTGIFGPITARELNPSDNERQSIINKLCDWYNCRAKGGKE